MRLPLLFVAGFALCTSVHADPIAVTLSASGTSSNFFEPLAGDLQVYKTDGTYTTFEGLEGTRLDVTSLRCFGTFSLTRGVPQGGGNCIMADVNGDKVLVQSRVHSVALGESAGTWSFLGGTGAHVGITGQGGYMERTNARTGGTEIAITGHANWPD